MNASSKPLQQIERMLKNSQTKIIAPIVTSGLVQQHLATGQKIFSDSEIKTCYEGAVNAFKTFLGHDVHIGAKYYDAYGSRMSRYEVLKPVGHLKYRLLSPYTAEAEHLCEWLPTRIEQHVNERLGVVPWLGEIQKRIDLSRDPCAFLELLRTHITRTAANFEIFSFAVLKIHLEKFACKIYRDTRTAAHDAGVDLSTNFGVVYQIKKLRLYTRSDAERIYAELKMNFDAERIQDGNVILIIDDVAKCEVPRGCSCGEDLERWGCEITNHPNSSAAGTRTVRPSSPS